MNKPYKQEVTGKQKQGFSYQIIFVDLPAQEGDKMTDWANQVTELQRSWLEQQQKLMAGWFGTIQGAGATGGYQNAWQQTLYMMEQQVNSLLDTQQQMLTAWIETMGQAGDTCLGSRQWQHQAEEGIALWIDTQHRFWKTWFEMLHGSHPTGQIPGDMLVKNWQDLADHAVDFQDQWLKGLTNVRPLHRGSSGKRVAKSSPSNQDNETAPKSRRAKKPGR